MDQKTVTDEKTLNLVREALQHDARFQESAIQVTRENGAVALSGLVPNPAIRAAAVNVTKRTRGVSRVIDHIQVQPFVPRFDADVTADVVSTITLNANVNPAKIDVQTTDGVVYLRGIVPNPTARQLVDSISRSIDGVRDVVDDLGIEPAVPHPDAEIRRTLHDQLRQLLQPAAVDHIHVEVRHGTAYLRGEVESAAVRWAIEDLVRWTPGVVDVVDELSGPAASSFTRPRQ